MARISAAFQRHASSCLETGYLVMMQVECALVKTKHSPSKSVLHQVMFLFSPCVGHSLECLLKDFGFHPWPLPATKLILEELSRPLELALNTCCMGEQNDLEFVTGLSSSTTPSSVNRSRGPDPVGSRRNRKGTGTCSISTIARDLIEHWASLEPREF